MTNRIRPYAWGSRTAIPELLGIENAAQHPQAELWMGAHPGDPSVLDRGGSAPLNEVIAADPVGELGPAVAQRFGGQLPFLLKVLAAAEPLSLQAHPSIAQAESGFDAEDRAGIPLTSPNRNYRDRNHKPELICAITEFHALCGFRDPATSVRLLSELAVPQLDHYLSLLAGQQDANGMRALFSSLLTIPGVTLDPLLNAVLDSCVERVRAHSEFTAEYRTALELGERYPGDAGALASLLLNLVTLQPGEALFLAAGNLHAYLSGVGMELMANSDNVLRGGLTPKHVDVAELMRVLDFAPGPPRVLIGEPDGPELVYRTPVPEFRLSRLELLDVPVRLTHSGPQVVIVTEGSARLSRDGQDLDLARGHSAWIPASDGAVTLTGNGTVFRATDGL